MNTPAVIGVTNYLVAAGWAAIILCAMIGWGGLVHASLRLKHLRPWAVRACSGLSFTLFLGGLCNFAGIISRASVTAALAIGFLAFVYSVVQDLRHGPSIRRRFHDALAGYSTPLGLLVVLLLAIRFTGSLIVLYPAAHPISFNVNDDFQAYFVYPEKMIQTGSMGPDPFSLRRTATHALGGNNFLKAIVLAALSEQNLLLLDAGLGTIVVVGLLLACLRLMGAPPVVFFPTILLFLVIAPPIYNTTGILIGTALFLDLFYVFSLRAREESEGSWQISLAALVGLLTAGICSLKMSLIPAALVVVGFTGLFAVLRSQKKTVAMAAAILPLVFLAIFVLPWLMDARRWTGTLVPLSLQQYYASPAFIDGYFKDNGWHVVARHLRALPPWPYIAFAVAASALLPHLSRRRAEFHVFLSFIATVAIGSLAILVGMGGSNNLIRYMFPFVTAAILITVVLLSAILWPAVSLKRQISLLTVALAMAIWVLSGARAAASMYLSLVTGPQRVLRGEHMIPEGTASRYLRLQQAALPGSTILAHLDYPFVLDFRRNNILIIDMPGGASASPGMPFFAGSEALGRYLVSRGVRYVAYDYASEARVPRSATFVALAADDRYPFVQSILRSAFDLHDNFLELAKAEACVYDDGKVFLVDLTR